MKSVKIQKGQYLEDIMTEIPNKTIIYKTLTGIGATTLMLKQEKYHAIIIVPNVPVIKGKCKKFNVKRKHPIKGVYEGVTIESITDYLNLNQTTKKFLTTPEGYIKIREAIEEHPDYDLKRDFFILFDECERLVQDVSYREKMLIPIDDFFRCKKKAMISATPIEFSDPRFKTFKKLKVVPDFDYQQKISVIETNNVEFTLADFIENNPREHYFIFHNSTDSITHLIKRLKLENESIVFCAQDSVKKIKGNEIKEAYTDIKPFKKYNFLTSRFFSAVDIEFEKDPTIILLTDLHYADHTAIDPLSEAIQIIGRFRDLDDFKPVKEVIHITNFNPSSIVYTKEDILNDVTNGMIIHKFLKRFLDGGTTLAAVKTLQELLKRIENNLCVTPGSETAYFFVDNRLFNETVKELYQSAENLILAYNESKHFVTTHLKQEYTFTDENRVKLLKSKELRLKTLFEILIPLLEELEGALESNPIQAHFELDTLRKDFGQQMKQVESIGIEKVKELKYNTTSIKKVINKQLEDKQKSSFEFIDYLERHFIEGAIKTSSEIKSTLKRGIAKYKLFKLKPTLALFKEYFHLSKERVAAGKDETGKHQKGYIIGKRRVT